MSRSAYAILLITAVVHAEPAPNGDFHAHMKAGYDFEAQNKWAEAAAEFEAAAAFNGDARAYAELGWSAMRAGPTYRFGSVMLAIAPGAKPTAKLTVDNTIEDCFALVIQ